MATLSIKVALAQLGNPDFSSTKKQLDAWEVVRFDAGKGGTPLALTVAQVAKCYYVTDCTIDVPIPVTYSIASELQDNITNAQSTAERNAHKQLLMRIKTHAREHYTRVEKPLIPTWETDVRKDLARTLPSSTSATTDDEPAIRARLAPLVSYWVEELGFRIAQDVNQWEKTDYPQLEKFLHNLTGIDTFLPNGFPIPKLSRSAPTRPKIAFPPCGAKKS